MSRETGRFPVRLRWVTGQDDVVMPRLMTEDRPLRTIVGQRMIEMGMISCGTLL
jgi:hypothetical protein